LEVAELRIDATLWSVRGLVIEEDHMVLTYGDKNRIEQLARRHAGRLKVLDRQKAYWPIVDEKRSMLEVARSIFAT
jgi:hypothetical protein